MNHKKHQQGLTLLEVIIAVAIITVVSVASVSGLMRLFGTLNDSQKTIETNTTSQALIESFQNQWRSRAYRPNPDTTDVLNAENLEIWQLNVITRELFDRSCIALDRLTDVQYQLLVDNQNYLSLEALDRNLFSRGIMTINFEDTYSDCLDLDYDLDLAKSIFVKRFSIIMDPNSPSSFNNLGFDLAKPSIACPNDDVSTCANAN